MSAKKTKEQFIAELNDSNVEVLGEYISNKAKILVRYKDCGHTDMKAPIKLLSGQRCSICKGKHISESKTKSTSQFINDLHNNGINYLDVIGNYNGIINRITVVNKRCGHKYQAQAGNLLRGSGCPICHGFKDSNIFKHEIEIKYPNQYDIIGEYVNNRTPILVRHKKCGYEWKVIPKDLLREIRCPKCRMSKGEYYIYNYLTKKNVTFEQQYRFKDCKDKNTLPFDFMVKVNDEIRLIEFDGSQHYKNTMYSSSNVIKHDLMKNDYCNKNNIKLLRIPYWWLRTNRIDTEIDNFILK